MLIEVTADDIRQGCRNSCSNCPVALAITRAVGQKAFIGSHTWRISDAKHILPHNAIMFIHDYDQFRPVMPTTFEIAIPAS